MKTKTKIKLEPYYDRGRHVVLKVVDEGKQIRYIPLDIQGLHVVTTTETKFNSDYKLIPNYPVNKAVEMFVGYSKTLGATKEVMKLLSLVTVITDEDINLATNKQQDESKVAPTKLKKVREMKEKVVNESRSKSGLPKQQSAAQMFKDLIMEGKLTDDQIFKEVQDNFGLDDNKRSYVKWYRNHLTKSGFNPPPAVGESTKKVAKPIKSTEPAKLTTKPVAKLRKGVKNEARKETR